MGYLSVLDKDAKAASAELAKAEALLVNLDAPRIKRDQAAQRLAEINAAREAITIERDALTVERADLVRTEARVSASERDITTTLAVLDMYEHAVGQWTDAYTRAMVGIKNDLEYRADCRRRIAAIDARLKEIAE